MRKTFGRKAAVVTVLIGMVISAGRTDALEFDAYNFVEYAWQGLNVASSYNPLNVHQIHSSELFAKSSLRFSSDWGRSTSAVLVLEGQYRPVNFMPLNVYNVQDYDRPDSDFFIKELFFDIVADRFNLRFGKQHITMGQGAFFNPLDVINKTRDLLQPIEDAEGNPLILINVPINPNFYVDLITIIDTEDFVAGYNFSHLPYIAKLNYSMLNFSTFGFMRLQKDKGPIFGASFANSFALNEDVTSTLYGELTYKGEDTSNRRRNRSGDGYLERPRLSSEQYYLAFLVGNSLSVTMSRNPVFEGLRWYLEYYYDLENWSQDEFGYYIAWLDDIFLNHIYSLHYASLRYKEDFRNSHSYLFTSLVFQNLFKRRDFDLGFSAVINMQDNSLILVPSLSYPFGDQDFMFRIRGSFFLDSLSGDGLRFWDKPEIAIGTAVHDRTEFGNELLNWRVSVSVAYTYSHF